jgi:uncharacterized membrane protein
MKYKIFISNTYKEEHFKANTNTMCCCFKIWLLSLAVIADDDEVAA